MLLAAPLHRTPLVWVEDSDEDAQATASCLEQRPQNVEAGLGARAGGPRMTPLVGVCCKFFEPRIVEAQHPALLEVRQVDPPAPAQVEIEPVLDYLGESLECHRLDAASHPRLERVGPFMQPERLHDTRREQVVAESVCAGITERPPEGGAQCRDVHEVVQVPGL